MIVAVDTGGTKTLIASFDEAGEMTVITKFPTPRDQDEYIGGVVSAINDAVKNGPLDAIVIAMPGPIRNGILQRSPNIGWQNFDVVAAIKQHFPECLIILGNDADIAGVAEARALENPKLSLYITLSTGVGTGLTYNGSLLSEVRRFEGGSMRIEYKGTRARWESVASGRSFYERYKQYGSDVNDPEKWKDYADRISSGLMALIPLLEPDNIIVGGSMGTHFAKYAPYLQEILDSSIAKHMAGVRLSQAKHPEQAVIYGCYYHAVDQLAR